MNDLDYLILGGGLHGGLTALALLERAPAARLALVERGARLGGNHTWCFHAGDVPADAAAWVDPLVAHRWGGYQVRFPRHTRELEAPYAAITSARFHDVVAARIAAAPNAALLLGVGAGDPSADRVRLDDGRTLSAGVVVDARGPRPDDAPADSGFQKFVGLELELERPHELARPVLMDACVDQVDGFRFFYVLPLGPRRLLVEDTYFSDSPALDRDRVRAEVLCYARRAGWNAAAILREEHGVLPMPWAGPGPEVDAGPLVAGFRGGWFHPATGYSLPVAVRLARSVAAADPAALFDGALHDLARDQRRQMAFAHRLNRMLFRWFAPEKRVGVFERFYRLPEPVIRRFYALQLTAGDRARFFVGRPPRGISWRAVLHLGAAR